MKHKHKFELSCVAKGDTTEDIIFALEEILRLVNNDFTSGYDTNSTGNYQFILTEIPNE